MFVQENGITVTTANCISKLKVHSKSVLSKFKNAFDDNTPKIRKFPTIVKNRIKSASDTNILSLKGYSTKALNYIKTKSASDTSIPYLSKGIFNKSSEP